MLLIAVLLILAAFGLFYLSFVSFWKQPGRALACMAGALVAFGAAWGILHAIGQEGF